MVKREEYHAKRIAGDKPYSPYTQFSLRIENKKMALLRIIAKKRDISFNAFIKFILFSYLEESGLENKYKEELEEEGF